MRLSPTARIVALVLATAPAPAQPPASSDVAALHRDGSAALQARQWARAERCFRTIVEQRDGDALAWYQLGLALHSQGKLDEALAAHRRAAGFPAYAAAGRYNVACVHALRDEADAAFAALREAIDAGFRDLTLLQTDADLTSLRGDTRYAAIVARLQEAVKHAYDPVLNEPRPSDASFVALPQARAFEFMTGHWQVRNTFIDSRGRKATTSATNDGDEFLGGKVVIDHYHGTFHDGRSIAGITIRAFDAQDDVWKIVWLDDKQRPRFRPLVGRFVGGVGHFYPEGSTAKTATTRFQWDDIGPGRARWMQQNRVATEQGERWAATWVMEFTR